MFPQQNAYRQYFDLSGFWDFRFDPEDQGQAAGWTDGFDGGQPIAVPASWNDQFLEDGAGGARDNLGPAWYQVNFGLPWGFAGRQISLRFGSVNYLADVWLNGVFLGRHEGGHMAFVFDATEHLRDDANRLVVRVDGRLAPDRVPPGNLPRQAQEGFAMHSYPDTAFDFFPYCGIQRPVLLVATPRQAIHDLTVTPAIAGEDGLLRVKLKASGDNARLVLESFSSQRPARQAFKLEWEQGEAEVRVPKAALWSPAHPNLYRLTVELLSGGQVCDAYSLSVGIRTVAVEGSLLLLNGEPVFLRGFCRHEDFPVSGRGYLPPVIVRDYDLLKWVGANSFRTSHYPYSEQMLDLADRLGFLVIDETQAVGLFFKEGGLERRLELCQQFTVELIQRDKNHPCVIAWSLANEPNSNHPAAKGYFRQLYDLARSLDTSRPVTVVSMVGEAEESFEFLDLVCLNRYNGWYTQSGDLDSGVQALSAELDALYARYKKPVILSEFGADALPGHHAQPPEMFSEEYQAELIARYIHLLESKPYVVGEHVWNLCDFKTSQAVFRMNSFNYKGVFTRDRRPKLAAHRIKELWEEKKS